MQICSPNSRLGELKLRQLHHVIGVKRAHTHVHTTGHTPVNVRAHEGGTQNRDADTCLHTGMHIQRCKPMRAHGALHTCRCMYVTHTGTHSPVRMHTAVHAHAQSMRFSPQACNKDIFGSGPTRSHTSIVSTCKGAYRPAHTGGRAHACAHHAHAHAHAVSRKALASPPPPPQRRG